MGLNVQLPHLYCPFPPALSDHTEQVQVHLNRWMHQRYLKSETALKRFQAGKFAWTTGRAHPYAAFDDLLMVATWMSWLFMLDDWCDEAELGRQPAQLRALHTELLDHMRHPRQPCPDGHPVINGLDEIWSWMCAHASAGWPARFIETFAAYANGCYWEALNRAQQRIPTLGEYLVMRRQTSALYIFFDLIEVADYVNLPAEALNHPIVSELKCMANDGVAWFNDIVSLEKEIRSGDVHNLVLILQHEHQLDLQDAIDRAGALFNERMAAYIDLEAHVPSFGEAVDAELARYLAGLRYWVRGNIDWSYETGRYGQEGAKVNG